MRMKVEEYEHFFHKLSFFLIAFVGLLFGISFLVLLLRLPYEAVTLSVVLLLILAVVLVNAVIKRKGISRFSISAFSIAVILISVSVVLSSYLYDTSFDGQAYHMIAVSSIAEGWNSLYEPVFLESLWVTHYPKMGWISAAFLFKLTGLIDSGKAINLIIMLASFFACLSVCLRFVSRARPGQHSDEPLSFGRKFLILLLAAGAAFNPVTTIQLFTYYNDGLLGSLLLTLISTMTYYLLSRKHFRTCMGIAGIAVVMLINTKFTALGYAGLICIWFVCILFYQQYSDNKKSGILTRSFLKQFWTPFTRKPFLTLLIAGLAGLLCFGWNPYVTNTAAKGHPFYPLAGKDKVDIMTSNSPDNFIDMNRVNSLFVSLLSETADPITPESSQFANLASNPFKSLSSVSIDTRVAGFGPFSPWILILSLLSGVTLLFLNHRLGVRALAVIMMLMTVVLINPGAWWARYVPHLWLVPMVLIVASVVSKKKLSVALGALLLAIYLIDAAGVAGLHLRTLRNTNQVKSQLQSLVGQTVKIYPQGFYSPELRLKQWGIDYTVAPADEVPCEDNERFLYTNSKYCIQPNQ